MASGDISNPILATNGAAVSVDIEGADASLITGFQSGKSATLACTSQGYTGTSLGSKSRSGIRTAFRSAESVSTLDLNDTFSSGSDLGTHTPDTDLAGNGWVEQNGSGWTISGGYIVCSSAGSGGLAQLATIDVGQSDGRLSCNGRISSGFVSIFIILRWNGDDNCLMLQVQQNTGNVTLFTRNGGTETQIGSGSLGSGIPTAETFPIQVDLSGSAVDVSVGFAGGTVAFSATDSNHASATSHGIRMSGVSSAGRFDDFRFERTAGARVNLDLAEPIHSPETALQFNADAGAFSDGTVTSNAASGLAFTNTSTTDYPVGICTIPSLTLDSRKAAPFYIDVYACAGCYSGHMSQFGVSAVEVTITDSAATARTLTSTSMQMVDRIGEEGWQDRTVLFRVGPFDPSNWDGAGTDAADGVASVVARHYPKIGNADSRQTSRTEYLFLDPTDSHELRHAVIDPTSGNDTTGRVATGDGGWSAGEDSVSATATSNPYATMHAAASDCQRGDGTTAAPSHNTCSWSVLYLVEDDHTLGSYDFGQRLNTSLGPVIVTRLPSAAKASTKITGSDGTNGLRTTAVMLDDLTVELGTSDRISTGAAAIGSGDLHGVGNILVMRKVRMIGPGRTESSFTGWTQGFEECYYAGCYWSNTFTGPIQSVRMCRDCRCTETAQDFIGGSGDIYVGNNLVSLNNAGTVAHADFYQFGDGTTQRNVAIHQNHVLGGGQFQPAPFGNFATSGGITSFAMTLNVQDADVGTDVSQLDDGVFDSIFFYHNVWSDGFLYREDRDAFTATNFFVKRNVFASLGTSGNPDYTGIAHDNNHNVSGSVSEGVEWTSGESFAALFVDSAAGDYTPQGTLLNRWNDPISPFDPAGTAMATDGSGAIGAIAIEQTVSGGDSSVRSVPSLGLAVGLAW